MASLIEVPLLSCLFRNAIISERIICFPQVFVESLDKSNVISRNDVWRIFSYCQDVIDINQFFGLNKLEQLYNVFDNFIFFLCSWSLFPGRNR